MPNLDPGLVPGEIISYVLFALCLRDAYRRGPSYVGELLGGLGFGLLLEYVDVTFLQGYYYGKTLVMLGSIPLSVGVGWAIIIYTAMLTTDRMGLPDWSAAFADALLALNIDLSMDAIAIRLGMWVWGWPPGVDRWSAEWFGVPYGNFFGWLLVVFLYSSWSRLLRRLRARGLRPLQKLYPFIFPILAIGLAEICLYLILSATMYWGAYLVLFLAALGIALGGSLLGYRARKSQKIPSRMPLLVVGYFHLYFLVMFFVGPMVNRPPTIALISVAMLILGLAVHRAPAPDRMGRVNLGKPLVLFAEFLRSFQLWTKEQ